MADKHADSPAVQAARAKIALGEMKAIAKRTAEANQQAAARKGKR